MKTGRYFNGLLTGACLWLVCMMFIVPAVAGSPDLIEIIYNWIKPDSPAIEKLHNACLDSFGDKWGNYYFSELQYYRKAQTVINTLYNDIAGGYAGLDYDQLGEQINEITPNHYVNGKIVVSEYFQPSDYPDYNVTYHQDTPQGIIQISQGKLGTIGETVVGITDVKYVKNEELLLNQPGKIPSSMTYIAQGAGYIVKTALFLGAGISLASFITSREIEEEVNKPPVAGFVISPTGGTLQTIYEVNAESSYDEEDDALDLLLQYRWDWENDGVWDTGWATVITATHQYAFGGDKTIKMEVMDSKGAVSNTTRLLGVISAPVAIFVITPTAGVFSTEFYVNAEDSYDVEDDFNGIPLHYRWDWESDGVFDIDWTTVATATHQYASTGNQVIRLEVIDSISNVSSATKIVSIGAVLGDTPWPKFRHNLRQTGQVPVVGKNVSTEKWFKSFTMGVNGSPSIGGKPLEEKTIYIGCDDRRLYAMRDYNGTVKWSYLVSNIIRSAPAIDDEGTIYFGCNDGKLYAIVDNINNASAKAGWPFATGGPIVSSPTISNDGTIYVGSDDRNLYAITSGGTLRWAFPTGGEVKGSPAVGDDGTIYACSFNGRLYAVNPDGTEKWMYPTPSGDPVYSSPAIASDGTIYFGSIDGYLYAINTAGNLKWRFDTQGSIYSSPAIGPLGTIYIGTTAAGAIDPVIYGITDTGGAPVEAISLPVGSATVVRSALAVDSHSNVFFSCDDGKVYMAMGPDGFWSYTMAPPGTMEFISSPAIGSNGMIYIGGCAQNKVVAIGADPLDPADIQITKKANKQKAMVGDVVTYKITLTNNGVDPTDINNPTQLIDRIPPGFKYIKGSSILIDGAGNITRTDPTGFDTNTLTYDAGWFGTTATATTKVVSYQLVVGSGVAFGKYENRAYARFWYNKPPVTEGTSNIAREEVLVVPDPIFDLGTIIGKVFEDTNGNGIQDEGEVGVGQAKIIMEDGTIITTDKDGKYHVPGVAPGTHLMQVQGFNSSKVVRVTEGLLCKVNFPVPTTLERLNPETIKQLNLVVLGEGIAGYNDTSGNIDIVTKNKVNEGLDDGFNARGRLAYYLSGTYNKDYTITSSFDSNRNRYRAMSRYIDPDKYYPLYGDDSTVSWDATNTQGMFYLSAEHTPSASQVLVGNYQTDLASNELFAYNRTLYGAKVALNTNNNRADYLFIPNTEVKLFGARAYQVAAHNEFRATGGSFYYLKHKNVIEGSEEVKLVSRDQLTNLPTQTIIKTRGVDYEIDYDMGRIIFKQVVNSVDPTSSIISTNILSGNGMYIVVDYEYEPDRTHLNEGVYGGRVAYSPIDEVTIGTGYVSEEELDKDYTLGGADLTVKLPLTTKVKAEYAQSESRGIPNYVSLNGGLTFNEVTNLSSSEGSAYYIKADSKLIENITTDVYYQRLRPGFMSSNAVIQQGTAKYGTSISDKLTDKLNLSARYDVQELLKSYNLVSGALVGGEKTEVTSLQGNYNMTEKLTLSGEYRYQSVENKLANITSETNSDTSVGAVRANYALSQRVNMYMSQQTTFKGPTNHQTSLGSTIQIMDNLSGNIQGTSGTNGNSALLGLSSVNKVGEKTELTNSFNYGISESATNERTRTATTTAGVSSQVTDSTRLYASKQYQVSSGGAVSTADTIGQDTNFTKNWIVGCTFERGLLNNFDGTET
ncbi:MAG: PQQ-binding-like beta-propeller repeat protein, partial [Planctomycetes bacterium]|nr:PQQ-binding-like beta-propeller repeat protein [Planctomycetota bacterium]